MKNQFLLPSISETRMEAMRKAMGYHVDAMLEANSLISMAKKYGVTDYIKRQLKSAIRKAEKALEILRKVDWDMSEEIEEMERLIPQLKKLNG